MALQQQPSCASEAIQASLEAAIVFAASDCNRTPDAPLAPPSPIKIKKKAARVVEAPMPIDKDIKFLCADAPWCLKPHAYFRSPAECSPYVKAILTDPYFQVGSYTG